MATDRGETKRWTQDSRWEAAFQGLTEALDAGETVTFSAALLELTHVVEVRFEARRDQRDQDIAFAAPWLMPRIRELERDRTELLATIRGLSEEAESASDLEALRPSIARLRRWLTVHESRQSRLVEEAFRHNEFSPERGSFF